MRHIILTLSFALAASAAEMTGWISDASCGSGNAGSDKAQRECAERCIKGGADAVFVSKDGKVFKISASGQPKAKAHIKGAVKVTGEVKGDTLDLKDIKDVAD